MKVTYKKHILNFKRPSGTSRGVLTEKETWFLLLEENGKRGIGECGLLRGLSVDDRPDYEEKLQWVCQNIHLGKNKLWQELIEFPSIQFGVEMAFLSLQADNTFELFPSDFIKGKDSITINGLVWMGEETFMKQQIEEKLADGFTCIKLKIGAIDFQQELDLLAFIRKHFDANTIEIRVDANGAFSPDEALEKLQLLSKYQLHSIEQPIKACQFEVMQQLCKQTPFPIALDEELIGIYTYEDKVKLLETIQPQYIILKPSFIGGIKGSLEWIEIAEKMNIGWWITSALESNVGLNAIAQFTYTLNNKMPQGLGTGGLYTNNFNCPLEIKKGQLIYNTDLNWDFVV
ncbi:o-succinylbenzoate synthase [Flavobacterium sp. F372]|uniref:O-succinylbenzoate synthase n=1 Tax=Flavobacterium bernardetii TaxID=2813823 RepID=A0ABR7IUE6_9FLAO|nr:o-succinylbenzoate synthase [Flavobacterium bernardetii]MBC5833377.1 o-succinylbenzoate synthase [Flavobacterium bernardetii]NHF68609.1 o-succinylbenzoate synthase [Flavobacterium bernardetii]